MFCIIVQENASVQWNKKTKLLYNRPDFLGINGPEVSASDGKSFIMLNIIPLFFLYIHMYSFSRSSIIL